MTTRAFFPRLALATVAMVLTLVTGVRADGPRQVLLLPFEVHSEKDLSFLKNAITDMLTSRLGQVENLRTIEKESPAGLQLKNAAEVARLGRDMKANYVAVGSVTVIGDTVSTDARLIDAADGRILVSFSDTGRDNGDVITHVDRFSTEVKTKVFGQAPATPPAAASAAPGSAAASAADSRRHPESLWTGRVRTDTASPAAVAERTDDLWRSRYFKMEIRGMAVADIDGDGQNEIVFTDGRDIHVQRLTPDQRLARVAEIPGLLVDKIVAVDAADINGNGKAEIFVTTVAEASQTLKSSVLEWDGGRLLPIVQGARWYWRVIWPDGKEPWLLGQKQGIGKVYLPGIERLNWNDHEYAPVEGMALPPWATVFGVGMGNVMGNGRVAVAFSASDNLRVLDPDGKTEWESPDPYGGGLTYLTQPSEGSVPISDYKEQDYHFLPARVIVRDADGDGRVDVFVSRNTDMAGRLLSRMRLFKSGHIESLNWEQLGLYPAWKTREISGSLTDFAVADIDNDGALELAYTVITQLSSVVGSAKSFIAAQHIVPPTPAAGAAQ